MPKKCIQYGHLGIQDKSSFAYLELCLATATQKVGIMIYKRLYSI